MPPSLPAAPVEEPPVPPAPTVTAIVAPDVTAYPLAVLYPPAPPPPPPLAPPLPPPPATTKYSTVGGEDTPDVPNTVNVFVTLAFPVTVNKFVSFAKVKLALAPAAPASLKITCVFDPATGPVAPVLPIAPVAPVAPSNPS